MAQDEDPGTVLVTGAGRRLGRSIALDFATRGWRVGIHYRDSAEEALELVAEIVRNGGIAAAFGADLARLETITPLIEACAEALGTPTCLINNAARFDWDGLSTLDAKTWQANLDVNLRAPVFLTQAFAKALPAARLRAMSSISSTRRSCGSTPSISPTRLPNPLCGLPRKPWRRRLPRGSG